MILLVPIFAGKFKELVAKYSQTYTDQLVKSETRDFASLSMLGYVVDTKTTRVERAARHLSAEPKLQPLLVEACKIITYIVGYC